MRKMKTHSLRASERPVTCVKFNRDGDLLLTSGNDGMLTCWSSKTGKRLGTYQYVEENPKAYTDEELLASVSRPQKTILHFDISHDSRFVVAARFDTCMFFEVKTGKYLEHFDEEAKIEWIEFCQHPLRQNRVLLCHTSKGGTNIATPAFKVYRKNSFGTTEGSTGTAEGSADAEGGGSGWTLETKVTSFDAAMPTACGWGPLDQSIIGATDTGKLYKWDLEGQELAKVSAHEGNITSFSFNKTRTILLTTSKDSTAALWNVETMQLLKRYQCDRPLVSGSICPLFDSKENHKPHILLAGGQEASEVTTTRNDQGNFEALLVNMIYENELGRVLAHYSPTTCIVYSHDGTKFATGAHEGNAGLFAFDDDFINADHSA